MGLIIKDNNADFSGVAGAQKYYFDALATDGTLLIHDYSRAGCLPTQTLKNGVPVLDLAKGGTDLNLNSVFRTQSESFRNDDYLEGGAMRLKNMRNEDSGLDGGINLGQTIQNYLRDNDVRKSVIILWVMIPYDAGAAEQSHTFISSTTSQAIGSGNLIRVFLNPAHRLAITLAGMHTTIAARYPNAKFSQVAFVYERGELLVSYRNGYKVHVDSEVANNNSWGIPDSDLVIGVNETDVIVTRNILGRLVIEDLDMSGRDAEEVITMDYNYVH